MRMTVSRSRGLIGIVCIALVLMGGMVQAAHFHASGEPDHDCTLCMAAHQVARTAAPVTFSISSVPVARVIVPRSLSRPQPAIFFRLSSRPPPVGSTLSA
jgi:hypothetical protein